MPDELGLLPAAHEMGAESRLVGQALRQRVERLAGNPAAALACQGLADGD